MPERHLCHAVDCKTPCAPRFLMCRKHWGMVPPDEQRAVYAAYVPGQERKADISPSNEWFDAAHRAIASVARMEGRYFKALLMAEEGYVESGRPRHG